MLNHICSLTFWSCISSKHAKVDAISQGKWQQVLGQESGQVPRTTVKKNATILKSEFKCEGKKKSKFLNFWIFSKHHWFYDPKKIQNFHTQKIKMLLDVEKPFTSHNNKSLTEMQSPSTLCPKFGKPCYNQSSWVELHPNLRTSWNNWTLGQEY